MNSKIKIQKIENYMTGCLSVFTECCTIPKESLLMVHEMFSAICKSNLTQARPTLLSILRNEDENIQKREAYKKYNFEICLINRYKNKDQNIY